MKNILALPIKKLSFKQPKDVQDYNRKHYYPNNWTFKRKYNKNGSFTYVKYKSKKFIEYELPKELISLEIPRCPIFNLHTENSITVNTDL